MTYKGGLGRGLGALIPGADEPSDMTSGVNEVAIDAILPNPLQPRTAMDQAALEELAASIREHGLIQALIVTATSGGRYQLIAGERRWRAAQLAGLVRVPVVVKDVAPQQMLELALVENLQRADLSPLEEAAAYQHLIDEFGMTQEQVAERVSKTRVVVANTLRLLRLPELIKASLAEGRISEGHARALLGLATEEQQLRALAVVTRQALSVRQTEELVRRWLAEPKTQIKKVTASAELRAVEKRFQEALGTRVELARSRKGGRIVIHYYSDEEFDALYHRLVGGDE
ncbi:MAG: ParB/RepB/Spo0J family partition protein [Thermoflexales bacterium]|nr:ParB/RepB/Spo0J family partition protein [Thermoflexales bacterium]